MLTARLSAPHAAIRSVCAVLIGAISASPAWAYRPFDGTDAAVADVGEVEVELQPMGARRQGSEKTLVGPWTVLNFGFSEGWEAVFEGRLETPLSGGGPSSITNASATLKYVLRPGSLQDKAGPSIATEFGVLLPDSTGENGFGAIVAGIVSQRWDWGTLHFNVAGAITREQQADLFLGTIIEGPIKWKVRPVAEFFFEEEFGKTRTLSGLIGAIWQVRDNLAVDIAFRHALTNGRPIDEIRAGVTFGFPLSLGGAKATGLAKR